MENPTYLGDAVYAFFNGVNIELRLNSHDSPTVVYLEPYIIGALNRLMSECYPKTDSGIPPEISEAVAEKSAQQSRALDFFKRASLVLAKFPPHLRTRATIFEDDITMFRATREEVLEIMAALSAGKWDKAVSYSNPETLDYKAKVDGVPVLLFGCEPPPSCKIIEEEEEVPAHTRKVRKLVCK